MTDTWLMDHARNVYSQFGEDGIIEALLDALPERSGWCVEFGAWDGQHLSNTYHLIEAHDSAAVLIEPVAERHQVLQRRFADNPRIHPINAFVGFDAEDNLDTLLAQTPIPLEYDVLSIDIDGNDYHAWRATEKYRPRVVVIEYNFTIPTELDYVQDADPSVMEGSSLAALVRLGREKGYELVATTLSNGIFVEASLFPLLGIEDNSAANLRRDTSYVTHIFTTYRGHIKMVGAGRNLWHGLEYSEQRFQQLPQALQAWPEDYGWVRRTALSVFRASAAGGPWGLMEAAARRARARLGSS